MSDSRISATLSPPVPTKPFIQSSAGSLGLRAGDWVEVRSFDEIRATLDRDGRLDALPFMPEMLPYCGRRFQVVKTAHKTCDTIEHYKSRYMQDAVFLTGLRCDGSAHGGCQAACLIYWKEAWLKRVNGPSAAQTSPERSDSMRASSNEEMLAHATRVESGNGGEPIYRCQATEMLRATTHLAWWKPGQYVRDLSSRNFKWTELAGAAAIQLLRLVQKLVGTELYPYLKGLAEKSVPAESLNLQPGELVQVRSKDEIMATLNRGLKNRGLSFDESMVRLCGQTFRVMRRVERIIDEKTGKMLKMRHDCIMLEGGTCNGLISGSRLGCTKGVLIFWREIWLRRVGETTEKRSV
jgi:hypothetical protein